MVSEARTQIRDVLVGVAKRAAPEATPTPSPGVSPEPSGPIRAPLRMNKKRFKTIPMERSMLPNSLLNPDIPQGDGEYDTDMDTEGMEDNYDDEDSFRPLYMVNTDPLIEARGVAYIDGEDPLAHGARGEEKFANFPWKLVKRNNHSIIPIDREGRADRRVLKEREYRTEPVHHCLPTSVSFVDTTKADEGDYNRPRLRSPPPIP